MTGTMTWEIVTPEQAATWLDPLVNLDNRGKRGGRISGYARDMRAGAWTPGESIKFGADGRLYDGQHRLEAVVQADVAIGFWVLRDLPSESYQNLDRGGVRSFADTLRWRGASVSPNVLASALTVCAAFSQGVGPGRGRGGSGSGGVWSTRTIASSPVTDADRAAYLDLHPGLIKSVEMWGTSKARKGAKCSCAHLAAAHHLICDAGVSVSDADRFMYQLVTQDKEPVNGTIRSGLNALDLCMSHDADRRIFVLLRTWNAWASGREVTAIRVHENFRSTMPKIAVRVTR